MVQVDVICVSVSKAFRAGNDFALHHRKMKRNFIKGKKTEEKFFVCRRLRRKFGKENFEKNSKDEMVRKFLFCSSILCLTWNKFSMVENLSVEDENIDSGGEFLSSNSLNDSIIYRIRKLFCRKNMHAEKDFFLFFFWMGRAGGGGTKYLKDF